MAPLRPRSWKQPPRYTQQTRIMDEQSMIKLEAGSYLKALDQGPVNMNFGSPYLLNY